MEPIFIKIFGTGAIRGAAQADDDRRADSGGVRRIKRARQADLATHKTEGAKAAVLAGCTTMSTATGSPTKSSG